MAFHLSLHCLLNVKALIKGFPVYKWLRNKLFIAMLKSVGKAHFDSKFYKSESRSHTFMEIDHEIISMVILLPSAEYFKMGCF